MTILPFQSHQSSLLFVFLLLTTHSFAAGPLQLGSLVTYTSEQYFSSNGYSAPISIATFTTRVPYWTSPRSVPPTTSTPPPPPPPTTAPASSALASNPPAPAPAPTQKPVIGDTCDVTYKGVFDIIEVRGKNFDPAKIGDGGSALRNELRKCGTITDWNFKLTSDDCCMQWYVSFKDIIGQADCIGQVMMKIGGVMGNCDFKHGV
jgi:hypothetical protein